jgi:hypothetical protein
VVETVCTNKAGYPGLEDTLLYELSNLQVRSKLQHMDSKLNMPSLRAYPLRPADVRPCHKVLIILSLAAVTLQLRFLPHQSCRIRVFVSSCHGHKIEATSNGPVHFTRLQLCLYRFALRPL